MATRNLSDYNPENIPDASGFRFGIVVSDWNGDITGALLEGAKRVFARHGTSEENLTIIHVPGSFELTAGARLLAGNAAPDAVICLGCVIRGETPHFDYICQGVTQGITQLNLNFDIPFIFGVLTTSTRKQAEERAGGKLGNKGDEAAITAIKMAVLRRKMKQ